MWLIMFRTLLGGIHAPWPDYKRICLWGVICKPRKHYWTFGNCILRELVRTHVILTSGACWGGPEPEQMAHFRKIRGWVPGMNSKSMKNIRNNNVLDKLGCPQSTIWLKNEDNYKVFWQCTRFKVFGFGLMKY